MKYQVAKSTKELDNQVEKAIQSVTTMRETIQNVLVSIAFHAYKHGDYTRANTLIDGVGNSVNQKALVEWFVRFGGLVINEESKSFEGWKGAEFIKENIEKAKETMWYDLKQQAPFKGFDLDEELAKLLKKAEKMAQEVEANEDESRVAAIKVDANKLNALTTLVMTK